MTETILQLLTHFKRIVVKIKVRIPGQTPELDKKNSHIGEFYQGIVEIFLAKNSGKHYLGKVELS